MRRARRACSEGLGASTSAGHMASVRAAGRSIASSRWHSEQELMCFSAAGMSLDGSARIA
jgi:hypothetical protein